MIFSCLALIEEVGTRHATDRNSNTVANYFIIIIFLLIVISFDLSYQGSGKKILKDFVPNKKMVKHIGEGVNT